MIYLGFVSKPCCLRSVTDGLNLPHWRLRSRSSRNLRLARPARGPAPHAPLRPSLGPQDTLDDTRLAAAELLEDAKFRYETLHAARPRRRCLCPPRPKENGGRSRRLTRTRLHAWRYPRSARIFSMAASTCLRSAAFKPVRNVSVTLPFGLRITCTRPAGPTLYSPPKQAQTTSTDPGSPAGSSAPPPAAAWRRPGCPVSARP